MNEKQTIAFVLYRMNQGGPARALLNVFSVIDYDKYDVSLYLFSPDGVLFNDIPPSVKIKLVRPRWLLCNMKENKTAYIASLPLRVTLKLLGRIKKLLFTKSLDGSWLFIEPFLLRNNEIYDFGIAFSEGISNYYLAKILNAKIKIGRVPTDYKVAQLDKDFDLRYFNLLDYIITNSENNINVLRTIFPNISDKFILFRNVIRRESILAQSNCASGFSDKFTGIRILTLSRLHDTKGTDLAVKACHLLAERGYKIKWYIMGDGDQHKYKELANAYKITDQIEFLPPTTNPYPYLKECDIYVQPSRYEGFSNAILEAKVLAKPIVITSFGSALEHIIHMFDGIVANMDEHSICNSISLLINDESLKTKLINNLKLKTEQDAESFNYLLASLANRKFHDKP